MEQPTTPASSDPLGVVMLAIHARLGCMGLKVLILKGGTLLPGNTIRVPLNFKQQLPPNYFGILIPKRPGTSKRIMHTGPGSQEELPSATQGKRGRTCLPIRWHTVESHDAPKLTI